MEKSHIRMTVVGDGDTGKTCMLIVYKDKKFEEHYVPTVFDAYSMSVRINGRERAIVLQDTAGQEEYDKLRPLAYPETDAFIMCFSVDNQDSFENIIQKWVPEIKHHRPTAKIILVATKVDLRDTIKNCITRETGESLKNRIKADGYVECSSKLLYNINEVFQEALLSVVGKPKSPRNSNTKSLCALF